MAPVPAFASTPSPIRSWVRGPGDANPRPDAWLRLAGGGVALAASLLLAACGGGGDTNVVLVPVAAAPAQAEPAQASQDPLKPYRQQAVSWEVCDATILGTDQIDLSKYGDRLRCAYIRAPLDYDDPSRGDVVVAMLRLASSDPARRRGTLFFNPGGPGSDGLSTALHLEGGFGADYPVVALRPLTQELLATYDMVGFSPRGTGASTRLQCGTNELERAVDGTPEGRTPQAIEDMLYNARKTAEACRKNPITPYINSEATARDLDLMRELLGEDKLNYLGYSYGTWLGGWYAARFPERVGRMVLDSNMNFTSNDEDGEFRIRYTESFQRLFDEIYAPYAARHDNAFNLGQSATAVRGVLPAIRHDVRNALTGPLVKDGLYAVHGQIGYALSLVTAGKGVSAVLVSQPPGATTDAIEAALALHVFVPGDAGQNEQVRKLAQKLYRDMQPSGAHSLERGFGSAVLTAVRCNDTPTVTDVDHWISLGTQYSQRFPLMGSLLTESPCAYWGGPSVKRPDVAALAALDILMVQSQYDGATASEGAREAFKALPQGHLVYVPGEGAHGVFPYGTECVDGSVIRYLLGTSPSARETVCSAKPLPGESAVFAAGGV